LRECRFVVWLIRTRCAAYPAYESRPPTFYPSKDDRRTPVTKEWLEDALALRTGLMSMRANKAEFERTSRGINTLFNGLQQQSGQDRLHQFVRSLEALILPVIGRTEKQFAHRCQTFAPAGEDTRTLLLEAFAMRSTTVEQSRPTHQRCAIYTRKSSEEGLEQDFNSLHAQREACEAFVKSQAGEGWRLIKTAYDDGGLSGATMERPALQRLMTAIKQGLINLVVVYKVDRLTRSLADFVKMVEAFDAHGVSFVSVTQQFNTTTSMGRLTLNVLLSFAQFEREVTGERIRDKIAASKRKGMWMGGLVPLGYDVRDRHLVVNQAEAAAVREIFRCYQELGNVRLLKAELDQRGLRSKVRVANNGVQSGGHSFYRGALYTVLRNPIYIGQIRHKGICHPGQHEAIVERDSWEQTQTLLSAHPVRGTPGATKSAPSPLAAKLFDERDAPLTPSHAVKGARWTCPGCVDTPRSTKVR